MNTRQRDWVTISVALAISLTAVRNAQAQVIVAGELVVDLQGADLQSQSTTWVNRDTSGDTAGDFTTTGGGILNIGAFISDGVNTVPYSLYVAGNVGNSVISSNLAPMSIVGNESRSAEAWLYSLSGATTQTPVGWGSSGADMDSSFSYSDGGTGLFNGWQNDGPWSEPTITNQWVHVVWTYDGDIVRGYRNGALHSTYDALDVNLSFQDLDTAEGPITVGSARGGGSNGFSGYIADVRVHSGLLSDGDILHNFQEGFSVPDEMVCDINGDQSCDSEDLDTLRSNLFTAGDTSMGDVDRSGFIDWADWRLLKDDPSRVVTSGAIAGSQVPEPSSLVLLLVAAAAFSGARVPLKREIG